MAPGITNNRNLIDTDPFWRILAPFENSFRELSNGAKLIQNGAISIKLRPCKISGRHSSASLNTCYSSYLPTTPLHTFYTRLANDIQKTCSSSALVEGEIRATFGNQHRKINSHIANQELDPQWHGPCVIMVRPYLGNHVMFAT